MYMITYKAIKISRQNSSIIADLVCKTYKKFNYDEADVKSLSSYLANYDTALNSAENLANRFKTSNINFGAFLNGQLIGVIRGKKSRIINLFIDEHFHNQGVGNNLIKLFEKQATKENSSTIKIRSSLHAVGFYFKAGYKKTTGIRLCKGIKVQPMKKELAK